MIRHKYKFSQIMLMVVILLGTALSPLASMQAYAISSSDAIAAALIGGLVGGGAGWGAGELATGEKGDTGAQGSQGLQGPQGDPFTFPAATTIPTIAVSNFSSVPGEAVVVRVTAPDGSSEFFPLVFGGGTINDTPISTSLKGIYSVECFYQNIANVTVDFTVDVTMKYNTSNSIVSRFEFDFESGDPKDTVKSATFTTDGT